MSLKSFFSIGALLWIWAASSPLSLAEDKTPGAVLKYPLSSTTTVEVILSATEYQSETEMQVYVHDLRLPKVLPLSHATIRGSAPDSTLLIGKVDFPKAAQIQGKLPPNVRFEEGSTLASQLANEGLLAIRSHVGLASGVYAISIPESIRSVLTIDYGYFEPRALPGFPHRLVSTQEIRVPKGNRWSDDRQLLVSVLDGADNGEAMKRGTVVVNAKGEAQLVSREWYDFSKLGSKLTYAPASSKRTGVDVLLDGERWITLPKSSKYYEKDELTQKSKSWGEPVKSLRPVEIPSERPIRWGAETPVIRTLKELTLEPWPIAASPGKTTYDHLKSQDLPEPNVPKSKVSFDERFFESFESALTSEAGGGDLDAAEALVAYRKRSEKLVRALTQIAEGGRKSRAERALELLNRYAETDLKGTMEALEHVAKRASLQNIQELAQKQAVALKTQFKDLRYINCLISRLKASE